MNLKILNTRPAPQNRSFTALLEQQGWISIECPALEIEYLHPAPVMLPALIHQMIFTSHHAVYGFFERFHTLLPATIHAIGTATAKTLASYGMHHCIVPTEQTSEGLLKAPSLQDVTHQNIVLVKGVGGRDLIESTLIQRGAHVDCLDVYRRKVPDALKASIETLWKNDGVDIVLYTSEESMNHLLHMDIESDLRIRNWLLNKPALVISERLALVAQKKGFSRILKAQPATMIKVLLCFNKD